jgi:hypothetical protein
MIELPVRQAGAVIDLNLAVTVAESRGSQGAPAHSPSNLFLS